MESVLVTIILFTVVLFGALTLSYRTMDAERELLQASQQMQARSLERARTDVLALRAEALSDGAAVEVTVRNRGSSKLADFQQWDVMLQYYDASGVYHIVRYPYGSGANTWAIGGIYLTSPTTPEVFEKGILNPSEEMVIHIALSPAVGPDTTNWVTVSTPNGISTEVAVTR
jgi:hypothetical protein